LLVCYGKPSFADIGYQLGLAGESSDNIGRDAADTRSEWITRYLAALTLNADNRLFTSNTLLQARYNDYKRNIYDDRADYLVNSELVWRILPQRLEFRVDDIFTRVQLNPAEADTPDNQQNTNVVSLGPTMNIRFGDADLLILQGRYSETYYETTDTDNRVHLGNIRYRHRHTPVSTTSLNLTSRVVQYTESNLYPTMWTHRGVLGYARAASRITRLSAEVGRTLIDDRTNPVDNTFSTTGTARLTRRTTRNSILRLEVGREVSDASETLLQDTRQQQPLEDVIAPGALFITSNASARLTRATIYGSQALNLRARKIEFEEIGNQPLTDATSSQRMGSAELNLTYNLTESDRAGIRGRFIKTEYRDTLRTDRDSWLEGWFERQIRKRVALRLGYSRGERDSSNSADEYVENRAMISLSYNYEVGQPERSPIDGDGFRDLERPEPDVLDDGSGFSGAAQPGANPLDAGTE